jgi:hypothetical protein
MLGPNGDPARTLDGLLLLRRRLMAASLACDVFFLRGAQEEMWQGDRPLDEGPARAAGGACRPC